MPFNIAIGPRERKSPYFDATVADGVTTFTVYNHTYMPVSYGDPAAEYDRLINGVSMWDVAGERQVQLKGPDAAALAAILTTRNIADAQIGQGKYAPICDEAGTLLNDPILLKLDEDLYWFSIADSDHLLWAKAIAAGRDLDVEITEPDVSPLAIQGPKAMDVAESLLGGWVRDLRYFWFREAELEGIPLLVARSGWSKQGGVELYLRDGARGTDLWNIVKEAGQPSGIGPGAPNYIERVESALLSVGADTDESTNPFEVRLGKLVDLGRDDDFIGKSALRRIARDGPGRKQVGLIVDGEKIGPNENKMAAFQNSNQVGFVSATAHSPRLHENIAIALVSNEAAESGGEIEFEMNGLKRAGRVTELPFC